MSPTVYLPGILDIDCLALEFNQPHVGSRSDVHQKIIGFEMRFADALAYLGIYFCKLE